MKWERSRLGGADGLIADRVWSVVRACGQNYWILAALFCAAICAYGLGVWRGSLRARTPTPLRPTIARRLLRVAVPIKEKS